MPTPPGWKPKNTGRGAAVTFLRERVTYDGPGCLIWPFYRRSTGYGTLSVCKRQNYAHRFMCELVNGPPPSPDHEAAHSCGNGHGGCVHPKHLSWKTASENHLDRRGHGTACTNPVGPAGTIPKEHKAQIRALKGKHSQNKIAAMFGLPFQTISRIMKEPAA